MNLKLFPFFTSIVVLCSALWLPLATHAQTLAIVNGKAIPKVRADKILQQMAMSGQEVVEQTRDGVNDFIVTSEIFAQEAERKGLNTSTEYRFQLERASQSILVRELFQDFEKKNPVSEDMLKAEYYKLKASLASTEYRARHILVEKADEARALIRQLLGGAKFEELAKKYSKDTGSGVNGGDLSYSKADGYPPEFSRAMVNLNIGEVTDTPVKTEFGYHIIKLEGRRENVGPSFEDVKVGIVQRLKKSKLEQYKLDLLNAAKTDYKFRSK